MTFHQTQHFTTTSQTSFTTPSSSIVSSGSSSANRNDLSFDVFGERSDYSETQFLKSSIANHTKYGSTAAIPSTHFQYVTHYVEPMDTLQGLALKYGCKIENIKKCNKLFSDDNNYLRSRFTLLMPIECSKSARSPLQSSSSSQESNSSLNGNIPLNSPTIPNPAGPGFSHPLQQSSHQQNDKEYSSKSPMKHSMSSNQVQNASGPKAGTKKQTSLCDQSSEQTNGEESIADFLIRIDSSIAASKREASKIAKKAQEFDKETSGNEYSQFSYRSNGVDDRFYASSTSGSSFRSQDARNNKTKYRYEKAHDEIFQL